MTTKSVKKMTNFPNFIIIMADQMRADFIESENPVIKTPNISRIEKNGIKFNKAYPPTPVCLPCRASILTGKYPSTIGSTHNETFLPLDYSPTIGHFFQNYGYYTHIIGKSHFSSCHDNFSPESPPHIHNRDFFRDWNGPWYGFKYADIAIGHTTEPHACGMHYGAWLEDHGIDTSKYFGNTSYTQYGEWDLPEKFHANSWIFETTKNALQNAEEEGKPFFLWINFQDPHNPCMVPEPWASMYDPNDMPPLGFKKFNSENNDKNQTDISNNPETLNEPDNFSSKPSFYQELLNQKGAYMGKCSDPDLPGFGNVSNLDWDEKKVKENAAIYCGMISFMDKYIGKILDELERKGLMENTYIIFTSDHGDLLGDHGLFWKGVVSFEEMMRVPLIIRGPGVPKGTVSNSLQSLIDIPATLLSIFNGQPPISFEGINQSKVWHGQKDKERDFVVVEERPYSTKFAIRDIITDRYKLVFYPNRQFGELYDIKNDPNQLNNLWNDESHSKIKNQLITQLLSHEILKTPPSPTPTEYYSEQIPKWRRDFSDFVMILGKLSYSSDMGWFMRVQLTSNLKSIQEIPLSELLEEFGDKIIYIVTTEKDSKENNYSIDTDNSKLIGGRLKISDDEDESFEFQPIKDLNDYALMPLSAVKHTSINDDGLFDANYATFLEKYNGKEILMGIIRAANPAKMDMGYEL